MLQKQLMNWSVAAGVCAISTAVLLGPPWSRSGIAEQRGESAARGAAQVVTPTPPTESTADPFGSATVRIEGTSSATGDPFGQSPTSGSVAAPSATSPPAATTAIPGGSAAPGAETSAVTDIQVEYRANSRWRSRLSAQDPATETILTVLDQPVRIDFHDEPLRDVMAHLSEAHGIPIRFAQGELDDIGLTPDTPVTFSAAEISLDSALNLMLKDLGLAYTISNEVLLITSEDGAQANVSIQVYTMREDWPLTAEATIELIRTQVSPDSWDEVGGDGSIDGFGLTLVVNQSLSVHQQIAKLVTQLEDSFRSNPAAAAAAQAAMKSRPARPSPARRSRADGRVDGVDGPPAVGNPPGAGGMGGF